MALYKSSSDKIEVYGQSILSIVAGMDLAKPRALRILAENGITDLKPDAWYSLQNTLNAFKTIFEKIGPHTLRAIGRKIPENAVFPPEIDDIQKGLGSIDIAFHMNHRGGDIGNYKLVKFQPKSATLVCNHPYPCDLDMGLIEAIADRFRPKGSIWVKVEHGKEGCRTQGAESCTYNVTW